MRNLADVLSAIKNADRIGKKVIEVPASNLIRNVLSVMKEYGYIGNFEFVADNKQGKFKINLLNKIVDCNAISPRFNVRCKEIEKYEKRFLPAKNVGILILTTSKGVMSHIKAKELKIGGKLLAYVY